MINHDLRKRKKQVFAGQADLIQVAEDELEGYEQFVLSLLSGSEAWHTKAENRKRPENPMVFAGKMQMPGFPYLLEITRGHIFFTEAPQMLYPSGKSISRAHFFGVPCCI